MNGVYPIWFERTAGFAPHPWQAELGSAEDLQDRLLRIPTGFGKTAGVVLAWLYNAVVRGDLRWPRRLAFTLPMRVLVEQTEREIRGWLTTAGLADAVGVHVLMGGSEAGEWALSPERPAILIGTQDMLLSRALNRGYAAARGRWPIDFGLLHHDALWVLDEIQLMDVGLATSAQLAAFRAQDASSRGALRPNATWWMSATLQPDWLGTVDLVERLPGLREATLQIPPKLRAGGLWDVEKRLERRADVTTPAEIAATAGGRHVRGRLSLIVVNRVATAIAVFDELDKLFSDGKGKKRQRRDDAPDLRLVHSRFRGSERGVWATEFLRRDATLPEAGRIVVATQVVEAGVDISAQLLLTEIAPWPSLVQRFGRAARYAGESARVLVFGAVPNDESKALPYSLGESGAAEEALQRLVSADADVAPRSLEAFEEALSTATEGSGLVRRLYPYAPAHVLRRRDVDELFDTSADLSGADLDVSRYIRSGEERDISVFWRPIEDKQASLAARDVGTIDRNELCHAPIGEARKWLADRRFYVLDFIEGKWVKGEVRRLHPGMRVLMPSSAGGYSAERGWEPSSSSAVAPVATRSTEDEVAQHYEQTAEGEEDDSLSIAAWKTIATHGREAGEEMRTLALALELDGNLALLLELAARWHDAGKAHEAFQRAIKEDARGLAGELGARLDLAKAPDGAWRRPAYPERRGFRHELVSTLALFELLHRVAPLHPALLGPHREFLAALGTPTSEPDPELHVDPTHPLAAELSALDAHEFDLVAYLVCSHHGKVRCAWTGTPHDQERGEGDIHGVREGDVLPALELADTHGARRELPPLALSLSGARLGLGLRYGASWTERVCALREHLGPFKLAYLEALLRAADVRASRLTTGEGA